MPIPVNATGGTYNLDEKLVAAGFLSVTKSNDSLLSTDGNTDVVVEIGRQNTSTMIVNFEPTAALADMPANRNGLLSRTDLVAGGSAELTLEHDKYYKIGVDKLGVKPAEASTVAGRVGGNALISDANSAWIANLVANGTQVDLTAEFADLTDAVVWGALVEANTVFTEGEVDTAQVRHYISPRAWSKLILDKGILSGNVDPRETAKTLLGIGNLRVVNLPADVVAVTFHKAAAAQGIVLDRLATAREDFDEIVEGRIKHGADVFVPSAVQVIKAAPAA